MAGCSSPSEHARQHLHLLNFALRPLLDCVLAMSNILLVANLVAFASAGYTEWYFSGNNSCPGLGIACSAPSSMCAYDSVADKAYCCSGESYDICRAFAGTCGGSDGGPSSSQQECTSGSSSWCCLQDSERCTQRTGKLRSPNLALVQFELD